MTFQFLQCHRLLLFWICPTTSSFFDIIYISFGKTRIPPQITKYRVQTSHCIYLFFHYVCSYLLIWIKSNVGMPKLVCPKSTYKCQKPPASTLAMHHLSALVHSNKKKIVHCLTYFRKSKSMSYSNLGRKQPTVFLWIDLVF